MTIAAMQIADMKVWAPVVTREMLLSGEASRSATRKVNSSARFARKCLALRENFYSQPTGSDHPNRKASCRLQNAGTPIAHSPRHRSENRNTIRGVYRFSAQQW